MPLSDKQQRFVDEYLIDLNAAAAYRRAGYKASTNENASRLASALMAKHGIQEAIAAGKSKQQSKTGVDALRILTEYISVGLADIGDIMDFSGPEPKLRPANQIPEHARRAIQSVKVKRYWEGTGDDAREVEVTEFRLWPKLEALKEVAARIEPSKPIQIDVTSKGEQVGKRDSLTVDDLVAASRFAELAGVRLHPDNRTQPVDTAQAAPQATPIPSANGHH